MQTIDEAREHYQTTGSARKGKSDEILEVAAHVLRRARQPLPVAEITWRIMSSRRWTSGKAIAFRTVEAAICLDIMKGNKRFRKVDKGVFALRKYAKAPRLNLSKARAAWLKLHEGKLPDTNTHRKQSHKRGKMSSALKAKRRYERHLVHKDMPHGPRAIRGFGTLVMRPINALAARVTKPSD